MYYDQIKLLKQGVEKARGLLGDAIDVVPGLGTVNQGLLAAENIGRGNLAGAAENIQNLVPTGKIAGRAIKALTKGKGQSEVAGVLNIDAPNYQGSHRAPYKDDEGFNAPLSALDKLYPSDVYSPKAIQYYGAGQPGEREALRVAAQVRNNPSAKVKMYRAVPKDVDAADINPGDWVTLSKDYAKYHGDSVLGGDYKILSKEVPAGSLYTNADSLNEFGYDPTGFGIQGGLLDSNTVDVVPGLGANSAKEIEQSWSARGIKGSISENGNRITLNKIIVPKEMRGSGLGTQAMNDLLSYADATGKTIALTPSADFGGQKSRLDKFYKGLGFEQNKGRSRDFEISESMLRKPKALGIQGGLLDSSTDSSLLNRYQAPQDEALALAQKRAALPVSEGGLGLPPDNTPMDRAWAGGFRAERFHETTGPRLEQIAQYGFDPRNAKAAASDNETPYGVFSKDSGRSIGLARESEVQIPLLVRTNEGTPAFIGFRDREDMSSRLGTWNPEIAKLHANERLDDSARAKQIDELGKMLGNRFQENQSGMTNAEIWKKIDELAAGDPSANAKTKELITNELLSRGIDTVDIGRDAGSLGRSTQTTISMNPANVRSRFAAFDPFRFGENDLLAIQGGLLGTSQDSSILNRYETDADRRMEIARRNAALPVEQGGLGLPENNTPMDRAKAMGFDVDNPLYHATTNPDVTYLEPSKKGKFGPAAYTSQQPDMAEKYLKTNDGAYTMKLLQRGERFDANGNPEQNARIGAGEYLDDWMYPKSERKKGADPFGKLNRAVKDAGFTSVEYKGPWMENLVVDNTSLRSPFAAFDPFRRNESDLLALQGGQYTPQDLLGFERMMGLLGE